MRLNLMRTLDGTALLPLIYFERGMGCISRRIIVLFAGLGKNDHHASEQPDIGRKAADDMLPEGIVGPPLRRGTECPVLTHPHSKA